MIVGKHELSLNSKAPFPLRKIFLRDGPDKIGIFCLCVLNQSECGVEHKRNFPVRSDPKDNFREWKSALMVRSDAVRVDESLEERVWI